MSLEAIIGRAKEAITQVKDYFVIPGTTERMREYALRNYIDEDTRKELFEGKTEEQIQAIYDGIEQKISGRLGYHQKSLSRLTLKVGKLAGLGALLNDVFNYIDKTPGKDFSAYSQFYVLAKGLLEIPAMYSYLKDSNDFYGAAEWLGSKAFAFFVPILGPAFDINAAQRIIKKGIIQEGVNEFLKDHGLYKQKDPLYKRIYDWVTEKVGPVAPPQTVYQN